MAHRIDFASTGATPRLRAAPGRTNLSGPSAATGDVVFAFSYLSWAAASQRGWFGTEDRLARGLVSHERVGRLLECDRARSLPLKLIRDFTAPPVEPFPSSDRAQLVSPVRLRRRDPSTPRAVARAFARYDATMERAAERMGMTDPVVITTQPLLAGLADLAWARSVTYYAIDDWAVHPGYRRWQAAYRDSYDGIRERERRVAAVSNTLLDRLSPTSASRVIANGLEPSEWLSEPTPPPWSAGLRGPLLVYVGTLDQRLDIDALRAVAMAMPHATLALVGPLVAPARFDSLRRLPNVVIHPAVGRQELTGLIRTADVGLIPHERSALTEAMSPLKVFEYLAAGLPVAAIDLAPLRGIDRRVIRVPRGSYLSAVRRALALGRAEEDERADFIEANSWAARHDALLDLALA
jgi:teichuronic acid biosynthesis glycosyltransferase TuaH